MVPLAAVIIEGITFLIVSFVVIMLYIRYFNRRKTAALSLAVAFNFWDLGALFLFLGKLIQYLIEQNVITDPAYTQVQFSDFGINLGYGFSALSNVFIVVFVAIVFSQSPMFRKTGMFFPIIFGALNGVTIGLLFGATIEKWPTPGYDIGPTIYHLLMTFISFSLLMAFTIRQMRKATLRWERAGFGFIIASATFGNLIYLSFAIDVVLQQIFPIFEGGFTFFYYLAYVFAWFMCTLAYFGYVMPSYVRDWFKEPSMTKV